jgi:hypothetical protein
MIEGSYNKDRDNRGRSKIERGIIQGGIIEHTFQVWTGAGYGSVSPKYPANPLSIQDDHRRAAWSLTYYVYRWR